jgi:hypothetical protein
MPIFVQAMSQGIASNQLRVGEFAAAVATLEPLLGQPATSGTIRALLALALVGKGEATRALVEARQAVEQAEERGWPSGSGEAWLALARATLLAQGLAARDEVERALDSAEEVAAERQLAPLACEILQARADLARVLGHEEAHARFLIEAERRYTEMGAPGLAALVARERAE